MSSNQLVAFVAVVMVAYVVPGPDWMLIMRHAARNRRAGFIAAAGVQAGLVVHMAVAALGVSAVLLQSATAFTVLKLAGGAYLVFLGATTLWRSRRTLTPSFDHDSPDSCDDASARRIFLQSMVANVLNPKAALFFVSILPQFLHADSSPMPQVLFLGVIDIALGIGWWALFVILTARLAGLLKRPASRTNIDRVAGVALVGIGGAVAARD